MKISYITPKICAVLAVVAAPAAAEATLEVWSWDVAADALKVVADMYEPETVDISVNVTDKGYGSLYQQLTASCAAGGINLPDVISIENGEAERFLEQFPDCFIELSQFGARKHLEAFADYKWAELTYGDEIYGIPWDSGQVVTFYRRDLFEQAGIDANTLTTWDAYIAAGQKLSKATNGETRMALSDYHSGSNWFSFMAQQNGCSMFVVEDSQEKIRVNQPNCVQAMEKLKEMVDAGIIGPGGWDDKIKALKAGRTASAVYGAWFEGTIRSEMVEQSGKWGVMRMPGFTADGTRAANLGGAALFVPVSSENPEEAYKFIEYAMTNQNAQIAMLKSSGLVPSLLAVSTNEYINQKQDFWGGQAIWKTILETSEDVTPLRRTRYGAEASDILVAVQADYMAGNYGSAQEALDKLAQQVSNATGLPIAE